MPPDCIDKVNALAYKKTRQHPLVQFCRVKISAYSFGIIFQRPCFSMLSTSSLKRKFIFVTSFFSTHDKTYMTCITVYIFKVLLVQGFDENLAKNTSCGKKVGLKQKGQK